MSQQAAIDTLVEALTAVPEYDNPLIPVYEALGQKEQLARSGSTGLSGPTILGTSKKPLTLATIRRHSQLIQDHVDLARDQTMTLNLVIQSCFRISPIPLTDLPLGF
jgi:hypothetical protein